MLPARSLAYFVFKSCSVGLSTDTKESKAAEQFMAFLRSPAAAAAIRSKGLEPIAP
jgi:molybdate transport system substrate-binding protein